MRIRINSMLLRHQSSLQNLSRTVQIWKPLQASRSRDHRHPSDFAVTILISIHHLLFPTSYFSINFLYLPAIKKETTAHYTLSPPINHCFSSTFHSYKISNSTLPSRQLFLTSRVTICIIWANLYHIFHLLTLPLLPFSSFELPLSLFSYLKMNSKYT